MAKFWVIFKYDHGRRNGRQAMQGPSGRHVAAEIRQKYPGAKIEAICAISEGAKVEQRRGKY